MVGNLAFGNAYNHHRYIYREWLYKCVGTKLRQSLHLRAKTLTGRDR